MLQLQREGSSKGSTLTGHSFMELLSLLLHPYRMFLESGRDKKVHSSTPHSLPKMASNYYFPLSSFQVSPGGLGHELPEEPAPSASVRHTVPGLRGVVDTA